MRKILLVFLLVPLLGFVNVVSPFDYDLHLYSVSGKNQRTIICFHGYGGDYRIADILKDLYEPESTLVSFNFPEHAMRRGKRYDPQTAALGTIDELLPALYVMKKIIIDEARESIDLYGFSAGGGAIINLVALLNGTAYDLELARIGMGAEEKKKLLSAIQRGIILLETPLKSVEEILDFRGPSEEWEILAQKYRVHGLKPIDSLHRLAGLSLNILLYFDTRDEILSNRDDLLYIERLQASQPQGKVTVILEDAGGHLAPHYSLWEKYAQTIPLL